MALNPFTNGSNGNHASNTLNKISDAMLPDPSAFGFERLPHAPRPKPRFLLNQQPQIRPRKFVQDSWDSQNQSKMLELESSIDDLGDLYETLRKMRDQERKVMEEKGLVDKADFAKDLTDAIVFQGTCLDMCPVFERARRNVEYTVYSYEKNNASDKRASRHKALKVFARPAAAAAPPLPSDVRPPHILVKTLDYIVDNLLDTLPDSESFLWDRMRSIRQDFTYQNYSGPEALECNERIVRIHLLIIHIMGKSGITYSLQQELEQLHKSLITLAEIYDDIRSVGGKCPNEAEFRAYALLSRLRDPQYDRTIEELPLNIFQDSRVQLALCFRRIISNSNYQERGYIRTENCLNMYARFFQLIKSQDVPFLMGSFLQIYLTEIRFYAIKSMSLSINKKHKPIPLSDLQELLAFNDRDEILAFLKYYSVHVTENDGIELKSLNHNSHIIPESKPFRQCFLRCVDEKLNWTDYKSLINCGAPNVINIPEESSNKDSFFTGPHKSMKPPIVKDTIGMPSVANKKDEMEVQVSILQSPTSHNYLAHSTKSDTKEKNIKLQKRLAELRAKSKSKNVDISDSQKFGLNPQTNSQSFNDSENSPTLNDNMRPVETAEDDIRLRSTDKIKKLVQPKPNLSDIVEPLPKSRNELVSKGAPSKAPELENELKQKEASSSTSFEIGTRTPIFQTTAPKRVIPENMNSYSNKVATKQTPEMSLLKLAANSKEHTSNPLPDAQIKKMPQSQAQSEQNEIKQKTGYKNTMSREILIKQVSCQIYNAFINDQIYKIYLESRSSLYYDNCLTTKFYKHWKKSYLSKLKTKKIDQEKRKKVNSVIKQLGAPTIDSTHLLVTPNHKSDSSFLNFSSNKKEMAISPVINITNKTFNKTEVMLEIWRPLDFESNYLKTLFSKVPSRHNGLKFETILYTDPWDSIPNKWLRQKFNLADKNTIRTYEIDSHKCETKAIDGSITNERYENLQLMIFNSGVTQPDIFDLELKIQMDGEKLIKLIQRASLNTNISFSLLILFWQSMESPMEERDICKLLKLNRIQKSYTNLQNIVILNIADDAPDKALTVGLHHIAQGFQFKFTEKGKALVMQGNTNGVLNDQRRLAVTRSMDTKIKKLMESDTSRLNSIEQTKHSKKNTYAHLQNHINSSPRSRKRKLPVLASGSKEEQLRNWPSFKYGTPTTNKRRIISSSSSYSSVGSTPAISSHLAVKFKNPARISSGLFLSTPSHSTNLPGESGDSATFSHTPIITTISNKDLTNNVTHSRELNSYTSIMRTPTASQTRADTISNSSKISRHEFSPPMKSKTSDSKNYIIPESILELRDLISSVKQKITHSPATDASKS